MEESIITQKRSGIGVLIGTLLTFAAAALLALVVYYGVNLVFQWREEPNYEQARIAGRVEKLKALRDKDASVLTTTGWIDESTGIAHVPIEEGMKMAVAALRNKPVAPSAIPVPAPAEIAAPPALEVAPATSAPAASPAPAAPASAAPAPTPLSSPEAMPAAAPVHRPPESQGTVPHASPSNPPASHGGAH